VKGVAFGNDPDALAAAEMPWTACNVGAEGELHAARSNHTDPYVFGNTALNSYWVLLPELTVCAGAASLFITVATIVVERNATLRSINNHGRGP
jgi:hypothetical protein